MKGIVFTLFNQLVEDKFGLEMWDNLLDVVQPESEGIYTAGKTYADAELLALVQALSEETKVPIPDLVRVFGEYMFPALISKYPVFAENQSSLKSFLQTVHDVIHVEVRKLYTEPGLPTIEYEDTAEDELVMLYRSPRKLCHLSEGLIYGAAAHYQTEVKIDHALCMHTGADHCRLQLTFSSSS